MTKNNEFLIGTRGSKLALWQANWVKKEIIKKYPNMSVRLILIKTMGDKIINLPLAKIGGKGLFIKEIEKALIEGKIDIAVHSMKDLPAEIPKGLHIGAIPKREDPRDVLVCKRTELSYESYLSILPKEARVGTSSLRRSAQILYFRPDIKIVPIRGNVETRINKLSSHNLDAVVLAAAGLLRLGFKKYISHYLDTEIMLPAVGQGALCVEAREDDCRTQQVIASIDDSETRSAILAERAFLTQLDGNCQVPIAANAFLEFGKIIIKGLVASVDGATIIKKTLTGFPNCSEEIGTKLAKLLLSFGAKNIL